MDKKILGEINRMYEIMGLDMIQEQDLQKGMIINVDGVDKEVVDIIPKELKDIVVPQNFEAGATELNTETKTALDATIQSLIDFLATPELRNVNWRININAGASQIPVGNTLAKNLGLTSSDPFVGRNEELAKLRAEAVIKYFSDKLKTAGVTNIDFPEANITIGSTDWESNKKAYKAKDQSVIDKFKKEQFMNLSLGAAGITVELADLPDICGGKMEKEGGRAEAANKGPEGGGSLPYATYPDNDGKGFQVDLGLNTEGEITFTFNSYWIPDMFQLTYNGETLTSSGPQGPGFVSNSFDNCEEGSSCARVFTRQIDRLKKELENSTKKTDKSKEKVDAALVKSIRLGRKLKQILKIENNIDAPDSVDLEWFKGFFEVFPPREKNWVQSWATGQRKLRYNKNFKGGYSRYKEILDDNDNVVGYEGRGDFEDGDDVWKDLIEKWAKLDKKFDEKTQDFEEKKEDTDELTSDTQEKIAKLEKELVDLQSVGESSEYSRKMTGVLTSEPYNFPYGVIGEQGKIVIDKIKGEQYAYIQVYAPLDKTAWECNITCKEKQTA